MRSRKGSEPKQKKQVFWRCLTAALAAVFLFSGGMLLRQLLDRRKSEEVFAQAAALIEEPEQGAAEEESSAAAALTAYETYAAVYAENPDFVGWLTIPDTNIDCPVMQTPEEPDYYLHRGFDRAYSASGVPYVQGNCDLEQSDNIILYGHHMKNGSMFADLCKFEDEDFYLSHPTFRFDTLSAFGEYEIIAAFKTVADGEDGFAYSQFTEAEDSAEFDAYVAECKSLALYETGVSAEYGDKLLTLSTCEYSQTDGRMVVVAKKISG